MNDVRVVWVIPQPLFLALRQGVDLIEILLIELERGPACFLVTDMDADVVKNQTSQDKSSESFNPVNALDFASGLENTEPVHYHPPSLFYDHPS